MFERSQSKNTMNDVDWAGGGGGGAWTACGSLQAAASKAAPMTAINGLYMVQSPNKSLMGHSENAGPGQRLQPRRRAAGDFLPGKSAANGGCDFVDFFRRQ